MRRACLTLCAGLIVAGPAFAMSVPDPMPIIVIYEMRKQRHEARLISRDPKAFWVHQIVARLEDKKSELPKPLKQEATVQVTFVVGHEGNLVSEVVSRSSGVESADRAALAMVEKAKPFPADAGGHGRQGADLQHSGAFQMTRLLSPPEARRDSAFPPLGLQSRTVARSSGHIGARGRNGTRTGIDR